MTEIETDDAIPATGDQTPTGVRRVNNMPLIIIGGVLTVFVILVALVASQRGENKEAAAAEVNTALPENSQMLDQMLAQGGEGGLVADPDDAVPSFPVARVDDADHPPLPDRSAVAADIEAAAAERMKRFQTAIQARSAITKSAPTPESRQPGSDAATIEGDADDGGSANRDRQDNPRVPVHAEGSYAKFDNPAPGKGDRWAPESSLEAPRTAYEVRAGSVIPAVMISGINAELPGQIIAQVSQDVFDTPTGKHRLIPQGSRLIGRYNHNVVFGQSRLLVAWQRIVFPDGKALDIGAMDGVDGAGQAGFGDEVDNHYLRIFGSAVLMSGITSGLTSSRVDPRNDPYGSSNAAVLSQQLAQQLGQVATKMIERNLDIAPTLRIRPGFRFNVMAVKDLPFNRPYVAFAY